MNLWDYEFVGNGFAGDYVPSYEIDKTKEDDNNGDMFKKDFYEDLRHCTICGLCELGYAGGLCNDGKQHDFQH